MRALLVLSLSVVGFAAFMGCTREPSPPSGTGAVRGSSSSPSPPGSVSTSVAAPSASAPPIPPSAAPDGPIGAAHPVLFQAASPDGRWVAFCEAGADSDGDGKIAVRLGAHGEPRGDAMTLHLAQGGQDAAVEDFIAADKTGRYVVVLRDARLVLVDASKTTEVDLTALGADARDDGDPTRPHRAASFDGSGTRLLYLRGGGAMEAAAVIVRDLASGRETVLASGPGNLWRAWFGTGDAFVVLEVNAVDTDQNGKLEWPRVRTSLAPRRCRGEPMSAMFAGAKGDTPVTRVVPTKGGTARDLPDLVTPLGERLLRRTPDGALVLEEPRTGTREIASAACRGRLLAADAASGTAIVVCGDQDRVGPVVLAGGASPVPLGFAVYGPDNDVWSSGSGTIAALSKGTGSHDTRMPVLYDFATGAQTVLHPNDEVLAIRGGSVLVGRAPSPKSSDLRKLVILDVASHAEHPLKAEVDAIWAHAIGTGDTVAVTSHDSATSLVIDLARGVLVGRVPGRAVAIASSSGTDAPWVRVLVAGAEARARAPLPDGPLRWLVPVP